VRSFYVIPLSDKPNFIAAWTKLLDEILETSPLEMAGLKLNGGQIAAVIEAAVAELVSLGDVKIPSMHSVALFTGFLEPLATRLAGDFYKNMPRLKFYNPNLSEDDRVAKCLKKFDEESQHVTLKALVAEARGILERLVNQCLKRLLDINEELKPVRITCNRCGGVVRSSMLELCCSPDCITCNGRGWIMSSPSLVISGTDEHPTYTVVV